jgi:hypothetical protein
MADQANLASEVVAHDDLCAICHLLLFDPVKTQCNHVLCASCMAQWADISSLTHITPSSLDLELSHFDPNYDPTTDLASLQANCPMCRTSTSASLHTELRDVLKRRYPVTYEERSREEADARGQKIGQDGIEGMTILIGNKHRVDRARAHSSETANKHDWTFFVRFSRPEIIQEVRINLVSLSVGNKTASVCIQSFPMTRLRWVERIRTSTTSTCKGANLIGIVPSTPPNASNVLYD